MATYRHTHTKQARRAKAHNGPCTLININTDALGGGSAGGISNFPVITETRGNYVRVVWTADCREGTVGGTLVRHVVQPQISGSTLCKARNRDIFVCKSTVRMRRARRSAGQTGHRGIVREGGLVWFRGVSCGSGGAATGLGWSAANPARPLSRGGTGGGDPPGVIVSGTTVLTWGTDRA